MNRKLVIGVVIAVILLLVVVGIVFIVTNNKHNNPICPVCDPVTEYCDILTGQCKPIQSPCGPPPADCKTKLVCNVSTHKWECSGCPEGFEGDACQCKISDKSKIIVNPCYAQIAICQKDGTYAPGIAKNCSDVYQYLADVKGGDTKPTVQLFEDFCGSECSNNGDVYCADNPIHTGCQSVCKMSPDPKDCNSGKCGDGKVCMCDASTDNLWKCEDVMVSNCPQVTTGSCINKQGKPSQIQCSSCGQNQYINYCIGSHSFPLQCLIPDVPLQKVDIQNVNVWEDGSGIPIYPTINNDKCKAGGLQFTNDLLGYYDGSISSVDNPSAYVHDGNQIYTSPLDYWYKSSVQPYNCWWDDHLVCKNGGLFTQMCVDESTGNIRKCEKTDIDNRLKQGYCDCSMTSYISKDTGGVKPYKGNQCQYDDNSSCNGNGAVNDDGSCGCNDQWFGNNCNSNIHTYCNNNGTYSKQTNKCICDNNHFGDLCQYDTRQYCNNHGTYNKDSGECVCDVNFAGPVCQFSRSETCHNNGTPLANGKCSCDTNYMDTDDGGYCSVAGTDTCYDLFLDGNFCSAYSNYSQEPCYCGHQCNQPQTYSDRVTRVYKSQAICKSDCGGGKYTPGEGGVAGCGN